MSVFDEDRGPYTFPMSRAYGSKSSSGVYPEGRSGEEWFREKNIELEERRERITARRKAKKDTARSK